MGEEKQRDPGALFLEDPLLNKIQQFILDRYEPVLEPEHANLRMTTAEVYEAIQKFYNNSLILSQDNVALWLHAKGFSFFDAGSLRFEWMFRNKE